MGPNRKRIGIRGPALSSLPTSGPGIRMQHFPAGRTIVSGQPKAKRGLSPTHPFKVTKGTGLAVKVKFGMVNSIVPTLGGSAPLTDLPAPELPVTESGFIVLAANTDGEGAAESCDITFAVEVPEDAEDVGHLALAYVSVTGTAPNQVLNISQSVTHSLQHQKCGETTHQWGAV